MNNRKQLGRSAIAAAVTVEMLETRKLLSATSPTADIDASGKLVVTGTSHDDRITVSLKKDDPSKLVVNMNGESKEFAVADITNGIEMSGGDGKDHLRVDDHNGSLGDLRVSMFGGNGVDVLRGGDEQDVMDGGNGRDLMFGDKGDDTLMGGNGSDTMIAGSGDDLLIGGVGNDRLYGQTGDDDLDGSKGHDHLRGGDGNDDFSDHDNQNEMEDDSATDDGDNAEHQFGDDFGKDHKSDDNVATTGDEHDGDVLPET